MNYVAFVAAFWAGADGQRICNVRVESRGHAITIT
jgi:hypothetical protein